jgi:hypothetical protein
MVSGPLAGPAPAARWIWWSRFRAAAAQLLCCVNPHEPPRASLPALVQWPATRGFVVVAVVGIPRWHARGQGFKSPQLHQAQRHSRSPAQGRLPEICQSLTQGGS